MRHKPYIKKVPDGKKAVLFIHGYLETPAHFQPFVDVLPKEVSVCNILLEGHGGTVKDFAHASMEGWIKQCAGQVDDLCKTYESVYIVGHSMGTLFALRGALSHPERVKGIVLLQPPFKICVKPQAVIRVIKSFFHAYDHDEVALAYRSAYSVTLNRRVWEYLGWVPRYLELFKECKRAREVIKDIQTPCEIFQAKNDELVSMGSLKYVPVRDNIRVHVLENSAHFIYSREEEQIITDEILKMIQ